MLKRLKVSVALIILGNLLYLALSFFSDSNGDIVCLDSQSPGHGTYIC